MSVLTSPAQGLMNQLKTAHKMGLISLVFTIPIVIFVAILVMQISREIGVMQQEKAGLAYIIGVRQLIQHVPEHRGMTNAYLNGNLAVREKILAKRQQIAADIQALDQLDASFQNQFQTRTEWPGIKSQLQQLMVEAFDGPAPQVFARHSELIEALRQLTFAVSNVSRLSFDDKADEFYMINLVTERMPIVTDQLGIMRGMGSGLAAAGMVTHEQESRLTGMNSLVRTQLKVIQRNLNTAIAENPSLAGSFSSLLDEMLAKSGSFLNLVQSELLRSGPVDVDSNRVFTEGTDAIGTVFALYDSILPVLQHELEADEQALQAKRVAVLVGAAVALIIAFFMFSGFYGSIVSAVKTIRAESKRLADGDLTARVKLKSRDELAEIGQAFNDAAKSFGQVMSDFNQATQSLSQAVAELAGVAKETGHGAEGQADQTEMVASSMNEMSSTVHEVARNASHTAEATSDARTKAVEGGQRISAMIREISGLSGEVGRAADVVQNLDKDVESISSVLEVISGISEQTNLLALNAAIEAARAGEHGRGFAVVADEVRGLAGRTQEATEEIQKMIERLQAIAQEATGVMKRNSQKSQKTAEDASQAEAVLSEILQSFEVIDDMSTQIASASEEQSMVAEEINRNLLEIKNVVDSTAAGVLQTSARCQDMQSLASNMKMKISRFKF